MDEMIPETEFSTIPFLGFFVGSIDTKVVGAARRGARPGRPGGYTFNGKCPAFAIHNDERPTMHQKAAGFSGGLFQSILCYNIFQIN